MRVAANLLIIALMATTALAGCSNKSATLVTSPTDDIHVIATSTTGVIRGIIVDSAIRPIVKAVVSVQTTERILVTNTTATGAFGFQDLKPGTYFIKSHHAGFFDVQTSVDVEAGVSEPKMTKIQMAVDNSYTAPFFQNLQFKGFIECGVVTPAVAVALCAVPGIACGVGPAPCNVTNDEFVTFVPVDRPPQWVQHELVWTSTQPAGDQLKLVGRSAARDSYDGGSYDHSIASITGASPLLLAFNETQLKKADVGLNTTGMTPAVFAGGMPGTGDQAGLFNTGVVLNQDFMLYTTLFFGFTPAEGWRFSSGEDPVVPPQ